MSYKKIDFKEAKRILDSTENCRIFDVREESEYITGHAVGAINFPLDSISQDTAGEMCPDKSAPVLLYCRSGQRSYEAALKFSKLGYEKIYDIGSLVGWPYGLEW